MVFIHGLGGDAFATWRHGDDDAESWPRWLGGEFPRIGVWSLAYAASPSRLTRLLAWLPGRSRDSGHALPLSDRGREVLDIMAQSGLGKRPILFICHSLGGLLVKQILRSSFEDVRDPSRHAIFVATRAVLFLATPHAGAGLATICRLSIAFPSAAIEELREHGAIARDLHEWYRQHSDNSGIQTRTYYETHRVLGMFFVVNATSSHPGVGPAPIASEEDHLSISKPRRRDAPVCRTAADLVREMALLSQQVTTPRTAQPRNRAFSVSITASSITSPITRLLGNALENQLETLATELTGFAKSEIERAQADWREGRRADARAHIRELAANAESLRLMDPIVAARVLRTAAGVMLDDEGDPAEARRLLEQAQGFHVTGDEVRLQAALLEREGKRAAAIALLTSARAPNALNLLASLLLLDGQLDEAEAVAEGHTPTELRDVVEQTRIRALIRFSRGNLPASLDAARAALALAPRDLMIRYLVAVLQYFDGLGRSNLPTFLPPWPQPADPRTIRRDAAGIQAFREAATTFDQLLACQLSQTERRYFETWRVAALGGVTALRSVAVDFAKKVLARDPTHPYMLLWAAFLDADVDLGPNFSAATSALNTTFDSGAASAFLIACLATERVALASQLLGAWKTSYENEGATEAWSHLSAQAAIAKGEFDCARVLIAQMPARPASHLRALLLTAEARSSDDPVGVAAQLEASAAETGNPQFLLDACLLAARAGRWDYVRRHVDSLAARLPGPESRRLAIHARLHTQELAACSLLLDQALDDSSDPDELRDLRRMRAAVRERLGHIAGAKNDAAAVVAENDDSHLTRDLLSLARLHFTLGERHELATCVNRLKARPDLSPVDALQLAQVVAPDDVTLAQQLWHLATVRDLPDDSVVLAFTMGYALGLDAELGALAMRMRALAAAGHRSVRQYSIDEVMAMMQTWQAEHERSRELYRRGEIATLFVAQQWHMSLVQFYHSLLAEQAQRRTLRGQFAVQLRDGSRGLPETHTIVCARGRLAMDLSAVLLAAHLELLPAIEAEFAPVWLPYDIIAALYAERERLAPHQPSQVAVTRQLLEAERLGQIRRWDGALPSLSDADAAAAENWTGWLALLERAHLEQAFVLDLPLDPTLPHGRPFAAAGPERLSRLVTVRTLRSRLLAFGADLSGIATDAATEPTVPGDAWSAPMPRASVLYLTDAGAQVLASSGLLSIAADYFTLFAAPADLDARAASIRSLEKLDDQLDWVDRLRQRIADGLGDKRYALLPHQMLVADSVNDAAAAANSSTSRAPAESTQDVERLRPFPLRILGDLLALPEGTVDAVWIEDRWLSRYPLAGAARLVDVLQILATLELSGRVSAGDKWAAWLHLRAANVRILPMCSDEIVHHLSLAPVEDGHVVETRSLMVLRQSAAILIEDAASLRIPSTEQSGPASMGDLPLLVGYLRAVHEALIAVWRTSGRPVDDAARTQQGARAEWIATSLLVDAGLLRTKVVAPDTPPDPLSSGSSAAGLLMRSVELLETGSATPDQPHDALASAYNDWIYRNIISGRADRDQAFSSALIDQLGRYLTALAKADADNDEMAVAGQLIAGRVFDTMPEAVRSRLSRDEALMERLGRRVVRSLSWDDGEVSIRDFAAAAAAAARGEPAALSILGTDPPVVLAVLQVEADNYELLFPDGARVRTRNPAFCVLHSDPHERLAGLEAVRRVADVPLIEWRRVVEQISDMDDPAKRLIMLMTLQEESLLTHYRPMFARWRDEGHIMESDFRGPSPTKVLNHLRFPHRSHETDWSSAWNSAVGTLLSEEGPEEAFRRLAGIPLTAPAVATSWLAEMPDAKRRALVAKLLRSPASPIALLQGIHLLSSVSAQYPSYRRLARRLANRVASDAWVTDVALLRGFAMRAFADYRIHSNETETPGAHFVATWFHAHSMVRGMPESTEIRAEIAAAIAERMHGSATRVFDTGNVDEQDIGHPSHLDSWRLAVAGLQYAGRVHALFAPHEPLEAGFIARFSTAAGDRRMPRPQLLRDMTTLTNQCDSWLPIAMASDGTVEVGPHVILPHAFAPSVLLAHAIDELQENPLDAAPWLTLELVLGVRPLVGAEAKRFDEAIARVDVPTLLARAADHVNLVAARLARQAGASALSERRALLRQQFYAAVRAGCSGDASAGENPRVPIGTEYAELSTLQEAIVNALYLLSQAEPSRLEVMTAFAADLATLGQLDTVFLRRTRGLLETVVAELPLSEASVFTSLLAEARGS